MSALTLFGRLALTAFFWGTAVQSLLDLDAATQEMRSFGLPLPSITIWAVIALKLTGTVAILIDPSGWGRIGAAALGLFTIATIPIAYPFWSLGGPAHGKAVQAALEHLSVIGGLVIASL
ncbi:hypothetical protein AA101099_2474 [Neoasaia chiangmaiensis NBRC 101099]|uniref:Uncharacterized protein n=1 Tax=Neoasaia chiangmaiensis TaxID=320497 RepID=A0A1U9KLJ3_9PROT|nr:DoxX family protein [Neoasaia chiangmaiensis]AQS86657.1 hypothetical protein A0U93_00380 [Neoasaia chiangmaiensis]GBR41333.1 hypothetical protein AA101099_2474 [Neoasaia chiangmaiensis NBRC 101099]GEN16675.1 hypothetical protein NCH01_31060 [Neoasaia chiangmaiensis]